MIARVFPRKTEATPTDPYAFIGFPPFDFPRDLDEVHVSVAFTYDMEKAEELSEEWGKIAPTKIGGPAFKDKGSEFTPGTYLKNGYVITSRGCPNNCWFCNVHKNEGDIRELPIHDGYNICDSNLLACSKEHITKVFSMLSRQEERAVFTGGLEAKILTDWHVALLWDLRPGQMFFAYDTPDDLEPLIEAGKKLRYANFTRYHMRCFVLIGYKGDTFEKAEKRLFEAWGAGFLPFAMLYKDKYGNEDKEWRRFQRGWARPAATKSIVKEHYLKEAI